MAGPAQAGCQYAKENAPKMIQDIAPMRLDNQYHPRAPREGDKLCVFRGNAALVSNQDGLLTLPDYACLAPCIKKQVYLFSIGDTAFFLADIGDACPPQGYAYETVRDHRKLRPAHVVFAEMTAWHLYVWYRDNRFCGRCGTPTRHDARLRMLQCPACGNMIFPKICPAVIVGVIDGDRILLTKYSGRAYKNYALIAGFTEIGETAEETVAREVMEEAGVRVKNIRYWRSQPWGVESDLLLGFFADLDGDPSITMDCEELSVAAWVRRDEIDIPADNVSLTNAMIRTFIEGRVPG